MSIQIGRQTSRTILSPFILIAVAGCATSPETTSLVLDAPQRPVVGVEHVFVKNLNYYDAVLYLESEGGGWRLGTIGHGETRRFALPRWVSQQSRFTLLADLIGSNRRIASRSIPNHANLAVTWTIGARATTSSLLIRPLGL